MAVAGALGRETWVAKIEKGIRKEKGTSVWKSSKVKMPVSQELGCKLENTESSRAN